MKWIKATDRLPANDNMVHINYSTDKTKFMLTGYYEPIKQKWFRQSRDELAWAPNLEWLDEESNDPVFSLEDMKLCWIMCDELHSERSGHCLLTKFYKEFMKTKYNIDHE